jgi:hypothetical protein
VSSRSTKIIGLLKIKNEYLELTRGAVLGMLVIRWAISEIFGNFKGIHGTRWICALRRATYSALGLRGLDSHVHVGHNMFFFVELIIIQSVCNL